MSRPRRRVTVGRVRSSIAGVAWKQRDLLTFRIASLIISIWIGSVKARDKDDTKIALTACCGEARSVETYRGMKHGQRCRTSWSRQWKLSWEAFRFGMNTRKQDGQENREIRGRRARGSKSVQYRARMGGSRSKTNNREEREKKPRGTGDL